MREMWTVSVALLFSVPVFGGTLTDTFSSFENINRTQTTATLNIINNQATLPLSATAPIRSTAATGVALGTFSIGDGSDGAFSTSTYGDFDTDGGTPNRITLDTSRTYQFTTFTLDSGVTVTGSGDSPLTLYVQGDISISGTIDVSGSDGDPINSNPAITATGGTACCGGGSGGAGGISSRTTGNSGTSADSGDVGKGTGGQQSAGVGVGSAGGGGGAYAANGIAGTDPAASGKQGAGGTAYGEEEIIPNVVGGSGGGGGGVHTLGAAGVNGSGGGGGAGGGVIRIHGGGDLTVEDGGLILAKGGNGGGDAGVRLAGGGGGGAGGAILIFLGGRFFNRGTNGGVDDVDATGGTEGTSSGGNGGRGGAGRIAIGTSDLNLADWPLLSGTENPPFPFLDFAPHVVFASDQSYVVVSNSFDSGNTGPTFTAATAEGTTPTGTTATVELAGSNDNFESDDTGFQSDLSLVSGKRYFRYRLVLTTTDGNVSPQITGVTVSFTERSQGAYRFKVEGCNRAESPSQSSPMGWAVGLLYLTLLPWILRRRPIRRTVEESA